MWVQPISPCATSLARGGWVGVLALLAPMWVCSCLPSYSHPPAGACSCRTHLLAAVLLHVLVGADPATPSAALSHLHHEVSRGVPGRCTSIPWRRWPPPLKHCQFRFAVDILGQSLQCLPTTRPCQPITTSPTYPPTKKHQPARPPARRRVHAALDRASQRPGELAARPRAAAPGRGVAAGNAAPPARHFAAKAAPCPGLPQPYCHQAWSRPRHSRSAHRPRACCAPLPPPPA